MISIQKVGTETIPMIMQLARVVWKEAYSEILSPEQMAYMLDLFYSSQSLEKQISTQSHQFILAMDENEAVGFASYSPKSADQPFIYRLHKIYILPGQQGKGVGKTMLDFITNDIRPTGATGLELNVNRHNKALGFYQKSGFVITSQEDIDIGNGYFMNDYVMVLQLKG